MNLDICNKCKARERCKTPCPPVDIWVDGNKPLRERLLNIDYDRFPNQDYKIKLIEAQESNRNKTKRSRHPEDFEQFRGDPRIHIITLALNARIKIKQIAWAMKLNERTVRRLKKMGNQ